MVAQTHQALEHCVHMMDVKNGNSVIAMHPVLHSRDVRRKTSGISTEKVEVLRRAFMRVHKGSYVGSSKSME